MKSKYLILVLLVVLIIPSFWFLFRAGFPQTDDGNWMIIRFSAFYQALRDGQFPVRFLGRLNFDYGYPVSNFLYPAFMYIAVPIKAVGIGYIESIKILIALCILTSGIFTFLWLSRLFDNISSFFASLYYIYAPYHLYDLTKRGSVGELLSLSAFPFLMWQIERQSLIFSSFGFALLIVSHNTLAILFTFVIFLYALVSLYAANDRKKLVNFYIKIFLFGLGISAFFWIPAVVEVGSTVFLKTKISDFNNYFASYTLIGIPTFLIFAATIIAFGFDQELIKRHRLTILMLCIGIISMFFASPLSEQLWKFLPVSFIQFPFRMLSLTIISGAFLLAFCLSLLPIRIKALAGVIFILIVIILSKDYLIPEKYNLQDDGFYSTNEATTTVLDEYMPIWVSEKPTEHAKSKAEIIQGEGEVLNIRSNSKNISFDFVSKSPAVIRVNTLYYPGWKAFSGSQEKAVFYNNQQGVMDLKLTGGNQAVRLRFGETSTRVIADIISIVSILILVAISLYKPVMYFKK